jgi:hypothetical protein
VPSENRAITLKFLEEHASECVVPYLRHLVIDLHDESSEFQTSLIERLLDQAESEIANTDESQGQEIVVLLQKLGNYDMERILSRLPKGEFGCATNHKLI